MTSLSDRCPTCHRKHRRSNPQNALYWTLLHLISDRVDVPVIDDSTGEIVLGRRQHYSPDVWHVYARKHWLGVDDVRLPNGQTMSIPRSTAGLDVSEFGEYFEKVQAWAAERGVWLADLESAA